jgi:hypothetical protein
MDYLVFLSHSMGEADRHIVERAVEHARLKGVELYIAERDPQYGNSLTEKIKARIRGCDCMVVLWTKDGADSQWVNREVGIAQQASKLVIPVVENGADTKGFWTDIEHVKLNREDPEDAIGQVTGYLETLKTKKEKQEAVTQAIVAGLVLALIIYAISQS